jgi:UDP-N-acetylmuramate dehydrogenase
MQLQENVALAPFTTLQVGGPARYLVSAKSISDIREVIDFAHSRGAELFVLGGGSNLVVSDRGWPGLVLKIDIKGIEERAEQGKVIFEAGAGESWDDLVARAVARDCAGVECLSGIPGSVGGTPVQNVGAYGQEVSETIHAVVVLDLRDGQVRELCHEACGFGYRTSIFNTVEMGRFIILRVSYCLTPGGAAHIEYADLKKYFEEETRPSIAAARNAVREIRARKAMLLTPGDDDCRSAGSFFKNPVLTQPEFAQLTRNADSKGMQLPSYPALNAQHKVSAAWLVEHSGFVKGYVTGNVGISRKHALAIVNRGGAKAAEIIALRNEIQRRVKELWGVELHPEPVFVGF